jgi:hypothetical protein
LSLLSPLSRRQLLPPPPIPSCAPSPRRGREVKRSK